QRHRDVLRILCSARGPADRNGRRSLRTRPVRSAEHRDRNLVPSPLQFHLWALRSCCQHAQSALDPILAADYWRSRPCFPRVRGTGFRNDDCPRSRTSAQRVPVLILLRGWASWVACQRRAALAGHDDGASLRQRFSCGHHATAALFQSFLARARYHLGGAVHGGLSDRRRSMSHETDRNVDDVGPGVMEAVDRSVGEKIQGYIIGLALAALLTAASFGVAYTDLIWGPAIPAALIALAIAQIGVHLVFFLHLTTAPDNTNNALALAFGVLIVTLIIA